MWFVGEGAGGKPRNITVDVFLHSVYGLFYRCNISPSLIICATANPLSICHGKVAVSSSWLCMIGRFQRQSREKRFLKGRAALKLQARCQPNDAIQRHVATYFPFDRFQHNRAHKEHRLPIRERSNRFALSLSSWRKRRKSRVDNVPAVRIWLPCQNNLKRTSSIGLHRFFTWSVALAWPPLDLR